MTGTSPAPAIATADIDWQNDQPVSRAFGDVYYSRDSGLEAAEYVFLRHNCLADRFARVPDGGRFVVGETGFGTGLNFLAAWRLWQQNNTQPHACLHFISVEPYPLAREDLIRALALWPELAQLATELIEHYPPPITGTHRLVLDRGRVRLTLCFGDVNPAWQNLEFTADAWFLDGFALALDPALSPALNPPFNPPLNPGMWNNRAIATISEHSGPGTSFATPTVAGQVPEMLADAGFCVSWVDGFGDNRNILIGDIPAAQHTGIDQLPTPESIGIIGAGIAGCLLANNLAKRGFKVTLIDQAESVAAEASGNRQGALYVKLGVDFNDQTELALSSLLFSQRFYRQFEDNGWHPTGLIQLAYNESEADRQARFLAKNRYPPAVFQHVSADQASRLAGIPVPHGGLWFPASGWLQPAKLCEALADQPGIAQRMSFRVGALEEKEARWRLTSSRGETLTFDRIVLCAGPDTPELIPLKGQYRMKRIRGQITEVPEHCINTPSLVVCGPGYINPAFDGSALVGATFDLHDPCPDVTTISNLENLSMLAGLLPEALAQSDVTEIAEYARGRVAFRCTTHDYQPIAGPMKTREGELFSGVYLFTGLGSKGLTYSPLLAEYLGDLLSGQPPCLPANLIKRLETQRCHRPRVEPS